MDVELRRAIERLSRDEKLALFDELWSEVRDDQLPVPASHVEELRRRVAAADADGVLGQPWAEVRKRLGLEP